MDVRRALHLGTLLLAASLCAWMLLDGGGPGEPGGAPGAAPPTADRPAPDALNAPAEDGPDGPRLRGRDGPGRDPAPRETAARDPAMAARPGRVVGRLVGPDGTARSGVKVSLLEEPAPPGGGVAARQVLEATTGEGGWFAFDGVPGRPLFLRVDGRPGADGWLWSEIRVQGGDDVLIRLARAGILAGHLVDATTGAPVVGHALMARATHSPLDSVGWSVVTDDQGAFRLELRDDARYLLEVGREVPSDPVAPAWQRGVHGPFDVGREDLRLEAQPGLEIEGHLVDESGAEVVQPVEITALPVSDLGDLDYHNRRALRAAGDGRFRLRGLVPGRFSLAFRPEPPRANTGDLALAPRVLDGIAAGTSDLLVVLAGGADIHGTLEDEQGRPITARGVVFAKPTGSGTGGPEMVYARLDGQGGFRTGTLDPATAYEVTTVNFPGVLQVTLRGVHPGAAALRVVLPAAARIVGRVRDEAGQAVPAGVGVMANAVGAPPGTPGAYGFAYTQAGGHYALEGLRLGLHFRVAAGGGVGPYVGTEEVVKAPDGTPLDLQVRRGVPLSGRLIDARGEPVLTSYLTARSVDAPQGPDPFTRTDDAQGHFRFPGVPAGKLRLFARLGPDFVPVGEVEAPAEDVVVRVPDR